MDYVCKNCGEELYISDQDPQPNLEDICCPECGGDVDYLVELDPADLPDDPHNSSLN